MDGFDLQASFKTKNDTLVNVRGDRETFDDNLSVAMAAVARIHAAEAAFKGLAAQTTEDAVALIQTTFPGAEVIAEYDTPPPAPPQGWAAPPQAPAPSPYQQTHCDRCKQAPTCKQCGRACVIPPKSVKGGQWWVHDCPSGDRSHKGAWCNEPR